MAGKEQSVEDILKLPAPILSGEDKDEAQAEESSFSSGDYDPKLVKELSPTKLTAAVLDRENVRLNQKVSALEQKHESHCRKCEDLSRENAQIPALKLSRIEILAQHFFTTLTLAIGTIFSSLATHAAGDNKEGSRSYYIIGLTCLIIGMLLPFALRPIVLGLIHLQKKREKATFKT